MRSGRSLAGLGGDGELDLRGLTAAQVMEFVVARCPRQSRGAAKRTVTALRSLLGFLHVEGLIERSLVGAVPSAASWRLSGLPRALEPDRVRRLLASCDRATVSGRRDFAILVLVVRLGLRAGEVAGLRLDDVNWRRRDAPGLRVGRHAPRLARIDAERVRVPLARAGAPPGRRGSGC